MVIELLKGSGASVKGKKLFELAGNARSEAIDTAEYLLREGWIELSEERKGSTWFITMLHWIDADALREALGLPRRDTIAGDRQRALSITPSDERLADLHASLQALSTQTLIRRSGLISKLDQWCAAERSGSRNTFSQMALDDTHAMNTSDWKWMEQHVDLESLGIYRHTPALWLRGPTRLRLEAGILDLATVPDMVGLSPQTVSAIQEIDSTAEAWLLVENRTSFEEVARSVGDKFIVIWMPGYVPDWWLQAMEHLVRLYPKPAFIAADPDPAGIEIALRASKPWDDAWTPWGMSPKALALTGKGKPLTENDRGRLSLLDSASLHPTLRALAASLIERQRKGEQEALDLPSLLYQ